MSAAPYESNVELAAIAERIGAVSRIAVTTHVKPDGDAVGSTLALARAIEHLGKQAVVWYIGPLMEVFDSIIEPTAVHLVADNRRPPDDVDLVLITDTGAKSQLRELTPWLERHRDRAAVIDHHIQGDADLAAMRIVRPEEAAASQIVADLIALLGVPMSRPIAEPLYLGIATDTGWFRFSNTTSRTLRLAADLIDAGVDHADLYRRIEQTDPPGRLRLLARALASLEIVGNGRAAILTLRRGDYEASDATPDDTHGFSDLPLAVESIEVACVIAETRSGHVKLSFRSKPGPRAVDVNQIARLFGGGGHARASGAKIDRPIDEVRPRVVEALSRV